jgi:hypothetical protein
LILGAPRLPWWLRLTRDRDHDGNLGALSVVARIMTAWWGSFSGVKQ